MRFNKLSEDAVECNHTEYGKIVVRCRCCHNHVSDIPCVLPKVRHRRQQDWREKNRRKKKQI